MGEFYYHEKKDSCILLAFHEPENSFGQGFVVPLDVIDSKFCIGGYNLKQLKEVLYPLKDKRNCVKMVVRTYNFIVPGIGNERKFLLAMDSYDVKRTDGDLIPFPNLLLFLRGIRRHGRPLTENCIDDATFNRIQEWKKVSFHHLLESSGLDIPLVHDKSSIVDPDSGLFHCEKRAMLGDADLTKRHRAFFQYPMISPKGKIEGGMSTQAIRQKLVSGCLSDSDDSDWSSLEEFETPIDTSYFDHLTDVQKDVAKRNVLFTYQLTCSVMPDGVIAFLANPANSSIIEGSNVSINPQLVIVLMGHSSLTLADICKSWFQKVCNDGCKVDRLPPAVLHNFEIRNPQIKKLVLSLDHFNHKPEDAVFKIDKATGKSPACWYCGLEGLHLPIKCPILDSRTVRNYELERQRRCVGCYSSVCKLGRNAHPEMCEACRSYNHAYGACYDQDIWKDFIRPAINNQHFIIAATQNLTVEHLNFLHKKIPLAMQKFEVHQAEHLSCGW